MRCDWVMSPPEWYKGVCCTCSLSTFTAAVAVAPSLRRLLPCIRIDDELLALALVRLVVRCSRQCFEHAQQRQSCLFKPDRFVVRLGVPSAFRIRCYRSDPSHLVCRFSFFSHPSASSTPSASCLFATSVLTLLSCELVRSSLLRRSKVKLAVAVVGIILPGAAVILECRRRCP